MTISFSPWSMPLISVCSRTPSIGLVSCAICRPWVESTLAFDADCLPHAATCLSRLCAEQNSEWAAAFDSRFETRRTRSYLCTCFRRIACSLFDRFFSSWDAFYGWVSFPRRMHKAVSWISIFVRRLSSRDQIVRTPSSYLNYLIAFKYLRCHSWAALSCIASHFSRTAPPSSLQSTSAICKKVTYCVHLNLYAVSLPRTVPWTWEKSCSSEWLRPLYSISTTTRVLLTSFQCQMPPDFSPRTHSIPFNLIFYQYRFPLSSKDYFAILWCVPTRGSSPHSELHYY